MPRPDNRRFLCARALAISSVALVASAVAAAPSPARAQLFVSPNIGVDIGGNAGKCPSLFSDCQEKRTSYGLAAGKFPTGLLGFEIDFVYAPDFFGKSAELSSNSVLTLMGNLLVSIPVGPIRPVRDCRRRNAPNEGGIHRG